VYILLRKNVWNGVLARSVTKIPQPISNDQMGSDQKNMEAR
jgi:hypothetical protein